MRKYMSMFFLCILSTGALAGSAEPIAVLKSDAGLEQKAAACRELSIKGGPEAVPVLATMLLDEKLSHMARTALEPMPCPEAGEALRDAMKSSSGLLKVGMINSLAVRKDASIVPDLIAALDDPDPLVAQEAARAIAQIGAIDAVPALLDAAGRPGLSQPNLIAFCNALCGLAEQADKAQAWKIYNAILDMGQIPGFMQLAAYRGAILAGGVSQGLPMLTQAVRGNDPVRFSAALRAAREMGAEKAVSSALAGTLADIPADKKVLVMVAIGELGASSAGKELMAEATSSDIEVRVAAINTLARIGYAPALDMFTQLVTGQDKTLADAAGKALAYFPGKRGDKALRAMLKSDDTAVRRIAVGLVGEGGLKDPVDLLVQTALNDADEAVRVAAIAGLQDRAGSTQIPQLLQILLNAKSTGEMQAAEKSLQALCARQKRMMAGNVVVKSAIYYTNVPDGPSFDVTDKVAGVIASGATSVTASNDNFGDPAPSVPKRLRVDYTENGQPVSKTVEEGEVLNMTVVSVPASIVEQFQEALEAAQGEEKMAMLRLLGCTGSPAALQTVKAAAQSQDAPLKDTALRTLCAWPAPDALPALLDLVKNPPSDTVKVLALRGSVRLLEQRAVSTAELLDHFNFLMQQAPGPDEKKLVLGGLAQVHSVAAMELALRQFPNEAVRAEALQAAMVIGKSLGKSAREDSSIFNGKDLSGWQGGAMEFWRCENGAIVGGSEKPIPRNEFLWSNVEVGDFYLVVDVRLDPATGNAGIQFRSKKADEHGQALGYQADMGKDVWGRLYHEHGRGKLDWTDRADSAVKPAEWNRYEILAVGPAIWTALNGKLGTACLDLNGERTGAIAVQIHAGQPETAQYKIVKLVHNPKVQMEGLTTEALMRELSIPQK